MSDKQAKEGRKEGFDFLPVPQRYTTYAMGDLLESEEGSDGINKKMSQPKEKEKCRQVYSLYLSPQTYRTIALLFEILENIIK